MLIRNPAFWVGILILVWIVSQAHACPKGPKGMRLDGVEYEEPEPPAYQGPKGDPGSDEIHTSDEPEVYTIRKDKKTGREYIQAGGSIGPDGDMSTETNPFRSYTKKKKASQAGWENLFSLLTYIVSAVFWAFVVWMCCK